MSNKMENVEMILMQQLLDSDDSNEHFRGKELPLHQTMQKALQVVVKQSFQCE